MNIEVTKLELMQLLLNTKKESVLLRIKQIFEEESADWWTTLSTEEQAAITEGLQQAENGEVISHERVMKRFDKWK